MLWTTTLGYCRFPDIWPVQSKGDEQPKAVKTRASKRIDSKSFFIVSSTLSIFYDGR